MLRVCTALLLLLLLLSAPALPAAEQSGFRAVDFNGDSKLTADEFVKFLTNPLLNNWDVEKGAAKAFLEGADKNSDGCVSDSEIDAMVNLWVFSVTLFMTGKVTPSSSIPLDKGVSAGELGRFDLNRDGTIDAMEAMQVANGAAERTYPAPVVNAVRQVVKAFFLHGNGCTDLRLSDDTETAQAQMINLFKPVVEGMFVYLDKDGNGSIELGTPAGRR